MSKKDNTTLSRKISLRLSFLKMIENPVICETHAGIGSIYKRCYQQYAGVAFEKDTQKTNVLSEQRKNWSVYECDCIYALQNGIGIRFNPNFFDVDPYGEPWGVIGAIFSNTEKLPDNFVIVVNDWLRQKLKIGAWDVKSIQEYVSIYGNHGIYENYLEVCKDMMVKKSSQSGYRLTRWAGYYCGYLGQMTHYGCLFERTNDAVQSA